jgi:hypothetical protein
MRLSRFAKHLGQDVAAVLVLANDQRVTGVVLSSVMLGQRVDGRDLPLESWDVKEKGKCTSPWDPKP